MKLIYGVQDKPKFGKLIIYAFQQLLAIIAATVLVPYVVNSSSGTEILSQSAALMGAGFGTIVYLLFTKFKSPVFLGSSFAFITPLTAAVTFGYWGVILGAITAGLVYVVIAIIIKLAGSGWVDKLLPPVIIGPVVALIGLDLSKSAVSNLVSGNGGEYNLGAILIGVITFAVTILASVKGSKTLRMLPFVTGVAAGYATAAAVTLVGYHLLDYEACKYIDFSIFTQVTDIEKWMPNITFAHAWDFDFKNLPTIIIAFAPVALVTLAEHIADHRNISSIIEKDLIKDPGLHRTLLGDGVGSMIGGFFGGCPNTTYGESVGCVAITGNASVRTIAATSVMCIVLSFFYPFILFINSVPTCVIGGICIALYGFIAVSGLRMFKHVDLDDSRNLFVVSAVLVAGIGGLTLSFAGIQISNIACALILGVITNLLLKPRKVKVVKTVSAEDGQAEQDKSMFDAASESQESSDGRNEQSR